MLISIALFEIRKRLGLLSTWVYFALFFAVGVLSMLAAGGAFTNVSAGAGTEKVLANAPAILQGFIGVVSILGVLVSAAVFGQAVHQDFECGTDSIFFTKPVSKSSYLGGRFVGAFLFMAFVFSSIGFGLWLGSISPFWVERSFFGPSHFASFAWPYVTTVIPNLLITGALFFMLATLSRRMMPVYVGAVVLVIGYLMGSSLIRDIENRNLVAMVDPFGLIAAQTVTRYWTATDRNTLLLPLTGLFLANRLLWLGSAAAALAFTIFKFQLVHVGTTERRRREQPLEAPPLAAPLPAVRIQHRYLQTLLRLTWLGFLETVKNTYFAVITLAGGIFFFFVVHLSGRIQGTATQPTTARVVSTGGGTFALFVLILITLYAGEITWRERDERFDQIMDAMPIPTWVPFLSKLFSLWMMEIVLCLLVILFGAIYQTAVGYHHYQLGLALKLVFGVQAPSYLLMTVLALAVQSMVQNKYIGHAVMIGYYVFSLFQGKLGLQHTMLHYGDAPGLQYSDMNGFGHFIRPVVLYDLYWAGIALVLAVAASLAWTRGVEVSAKTRRAIARARLTPRVLTVATAGLLIASGAGGVILYNTLILNHYRTDRAREALQAQYEKKYKNLQDVPQPRITDVRTDFDIYPATETLDARGRYLLDNKSGKPIKTIYVRLPGDQEFSRLSIGEVTQPTTRDPAQGFYSFELPRPMAPGDRLPLEFDLRFHDKGFKEGGNRTDVSENGTFFNNGNLPHLGYDDAVELEPDNVRRKYGLAPRERMKDLNDATGLANNLLSTDADWITFESTVSTSPDQIAVVPGYLDREWTENGRRYFHYKMDSKILDFYSVLSARYAVRRDSWKGVALEIYYHPGHEFDLDEMMQGLKESLAYGTANFGPYQHHQARILEFPRYGSFAQSFPNTIPYSEAIGFVARVDHAKPDDVDYPLFVTSHEMGHQWWAHQVIGGRVQGVSMLDETLAEYTGMMVMKKKFGSGQMRRFLKYELDQYLQGRAFEQKKEMPLERVENQQYIHYNKGGVVMYALQDYLGEENVNRALKTFLDKTRLQGPPYPKSTDLINEFKKVAPPDLQYLVHDLFEVITLYDNRAVSASAKKRSDGRYDVTVKIQTKKMQADALGKETEVPVDDLIAVGAVDEKGEPIFLEKRRLKTGESVQAFISDKLPAKAGIDPLDTLVDRHPDDNVITVSVVE